MLSKLYGFWDEHSFLTKTGDPGAVPGGGGVLLEVEAEVTLVGVVDEGDLDGVVKLRESGGRRSRERKTGDLAEGVDDLA